MIALAFGAIAITLAASIVSFFDVPNGVRVTAIVVLFVGLIPILMCSKFVNWKLCVPGANDNLTGVFASCLLYTSYTKTVRYSQYRAIQFSVCAYSVPVLLSNMQYY